MKNNLISCLRRVMKKNAGFDLLLILAILLSVIISILPPLLLEKVINDLTLHKELETFLIIGYLALLICSGILDSLKESLITIFGQKVTKGLRESMSAKLVRLPAAYFVKQDSGMITSRFVNDVDMVENLFTSGIISMFADTLKVIGILGIIFVKSKGLGLLMFLIFPLLFAISFYIQNHMLLAQKENRTAVAKANNHIPETIRNFTMIRSFHAYRFMQKKYATYIEDGFQATEKANFYDAVYSPTIITLSAIVVAVMMCLASIGSGIQEFFGISVGSAVAIISYVSKVFEPIESIGMEIQNVQSAIAGIGRVNEFLREPERILSRVTPSFQKEEPAVSFKNVYFGYEEQIKIIHGLSMYIKDGENVILTGRTGIGKSTIFKLIQGLYMADEGSITIYGVPVSEIPDVIKSRMIGYVEQTFKMINGTVEEQITLKDLTISREQVEYALCLVGLEDVVKGMDKGYNTMCTQALFSQGQWQLLSIARAIIKNPPILLLDEITANLDSETEKTVLLALKKASSQRTVISISHRLQAIERKSRIIEIT